MKTRQLVLVLAALGLLSTNAAAQDSTLSPVNVMGALRVGKRCGSDAPPLRAIFSAQVTGTDVNVPNQTLQGNATITLNESATSEVNDGSYRMVLQRDVGGTPIDYRILSQFYFDGGSRLLTQLLSASQTMPLTGDVQLSHDAGNSASIVVTVVTPAGANITQLIGIATHGNPNDPSVSSTFSSSVEISGSATPVGLAGYVSTVDPQTGVETAAFELLVPPNRNYQIEVHAGFNGQGTQPIGGFQVQASDAPPCATFAPAPLVAAIEPSGTLEVTAFLEPDPADVLSETGPRATHYDLTYVGTRLNGQPVIINNYGYLSGGTAVSNGPGPVTLTSAPFPLGVYELTLFSAHPKILLSWPDRIPPPGFGPFYNFPAPGLGLWTPAHLGTLPGQGMDEDGSVVLNQNDLQPDGRIVERLSFHGLMAYATGTLALNGCVETPHIAAGAVEATSVFGDNTSGTFINELGQLRLRGNVDWPGQGFVRGLFTNDGTGHYELAATQGQWREYAYRLHLTDSTGLDETLSILPDSQWLENLTPGRAHTLEIPPQFYPTGQVTARLTVQNTPQQIAAGAPALRPFRAPELVVVGASQSYGADWAALPFSGLNGESGRFWSVSSGKNELRNEHFVRVHGVANSVGDIAVKAQVPLNPDGTGASPVTSFPSILSVPFSSGASGTCQETCVDLATQTAYVDNGVGPLVTLSSAPPAQTQAASLVLSGIASDTSPVIHVTVNGQEVAGSNSQLQQPFSAPVALTVGTNTFTIVATDLCGHTTTQVVTVERVECSANNPSCEGCIGVHLNDYNVFVLEDYTLGTDVEGKVAAGGNITLNHFSVGSRVANNDLANTLVAGGDLTLTNGAVWGDARYGGNSSSDGTVVFPRGTSVAQGSPINFQTRGAALQALSTQLRALSANGTTTLESWGGLMLRGTAPHVNIFQVNASAFTGAKLLSIDAPAGSLAVINVFGSTATLTGFGHSFSGGINQRGVLFNFVDATRITAHGYGFWGTVLAPYAQVSFHNGSFDGGIYARSLTGNAEGHLNPLDDVDICQ
ncbi:choice-of-anchor A family protein [Stigmatella sp. ncwal1]|uniref:Choice-of-anchor A family protein n=1 Tax=Stigmatella ashevillensis TaxID=2995309 RepID=A0ABT5DI19_9BACT|nr:choice-of-anchor A family protein [Stigmatella ashevillena]MDC0713273.1 choice-of-anchor A family protein [Stigmatella ashevillena]